MLALVTLLAALTCGQVIGAGQVVCEGEQPVEVIVSHYPEGTGSAAFYRVCNSGQQQSVPDGINLTCVDYDGTITPYDPTIWNKMFCTWDEDPGAEETPVAVYANGWWYAGADGPTASEVVIDLEFDGEALTIFNHNGSLPMLVFKSRDPYQARQGYFSAFYGSSGEYSEFNEGCGFIDADTDNTGMWYYEVK